MRFGGRSACECPISWFPASITVLRSLPLSPNGKVDRSATCSIETQSGVRGSPFLAAVRRLSARPSSRYCDRRSWAGWDRGRGQFLRSRRLVFRPNSNPREMVEAFGPVVTAVDLFGHPNIKAVAAKIDGRADGPMTFISTAERARRRSAALRRTHLAASRAGAA